MKIYKQTSYLVFLAFSILYFTTRLYNLNSLPVFADEAIYVRWAQIIKSVETLRFIPLTDGKQPLYMWIVAIFLKLIKDPLIAGRTVSILSGYLTFIASWLILGVLKNKEISSNPLTFLVNSFRVSLKEKVVFSLILLTNSYSLFFDRLATADSLLTALIAWSVLIALLQKKYQRLDLAMLLGITLGMSWITKSPAIFFYILLCPYLTFSRLSMVKKITLYLTSGVFMAIIYNSLRLGPQFHMLSSRSSEYVWPLSHLLLSPLDPLKPHLQALINIYITYLGPLSLIPIIVFATRKNKENGSLVLLFLWLLPTLGVLSVAKVFTSRYLLFTLPFLLMYYSQLTTLVLKNRIFYLLFLISLTVQALYSYKLVSNPFEIKLAKNDLGYIQDWTSGWGLKDISEFLISEANSGKNVVVGVEGSFGNPKDAIQMYSNQVNRLTIVPQDVSTVSISSSLLGAVKYGDEVYIIANSSRTKLDSFSQSKVQLIKSYKKPDGSYHNLFKIKK